MVDIYLRDLGLGEKEIEVYLTILRSGKIAPTTLSKLTGINRTTVYSVTKELLGRGIIAEDLGTPNRLLIALPPQELGNIIKREERKIVEKKHAMEKAVEELSALTKNLQYSVPKIVFIGEEDFEQYLYKQSPAWSESMAKAGGIWWGFQDPSFAENYQEWIDWYWKSPISKEISAQLIGSKSAVETELATRDYARRNVKFWKEAKGISSSIWVGGDYVVMVSTSQKPHYLVDINDAAFARNMSALFKGIWDTI